MATPVGHALFGMAFAVFGTSRREADSASRKLSMGFAFFLAFSGIAADLDFLPGLVAGDINRWHHQASHSVVAAILYGLLTWVLIAGCRPLRSRFTARLRLRCSVVAAFAYASHLVLDCLTSDSRAPVGIPLFWPFKSQAIIAPITPIPGVAHGVPGDSLGVVLDHIFSLQNFIGIGIEILVVLPFIFLMMFVYYIRGLSSQSVQRS